MKELSDYKLTDGVTVGQLQSWITNKSDSSKESIVKLIEHRFENRYLKHVKSIDSGFLMMAVSCFLIETIQSFREGEINTNGKSQNMFRNFFFNDKELFPGFHEIADDFYKNIRCGILHQAETTNAWRILRKGKFLDTSQFSINANHFTQGLDGSVKKYVHELTMSDFDTTIWNNAFAKLNDICENCKRK